jgi:hypothetical protein
VYELLQEDSDSPIHAYYSRLNPAYHRLRRSAIAAPQQGTTEKAMLTLPSSGLDDMRRPTDGPERTDGATAAVGPRRAGTPAIGEKASAGAATAARMDARIMVVLDYGGDDEATVCMAFGPLSPHG